MDIKLILENQLLLLRVSLHIVARASPEHEQLHRQIEKTERRLKSWGQPIT
jgi:hypothetical protein